MNATAPGKREGKMNANRRTNDTLLATIAVALALAGCSASPGKPKYADDPRTDTMTMAEMRMDEAGGPSPAAKPAGLANPQAAPSAPDPNALTDAGANTPLGKNWTFTQVDGFDGELPGPPRNATMILSRENGRMAGTTSCNPMTSAFEISIAQGTLSFRRIDNGSALCGEPNADIEDAVVDALAATDSFLLDGKTLTLRSKGRTVAVLTTP